MPNNLDKDPLTGSPTKYMTGEALRWVGRVIYHKLIKPGVIEVKNLQGHEDKEVFDETREKNSNAVGSSASRLLASAIIGGILWPDNPNTSFVQETAKVISDPVGLAGIGFVVYYGLDTVSTWWKAIGANRQLDLLQARRKGEKKLK